MRAFQRWFLLGAALGGQLLLIGCSKKSVPADASGPAPTVSIAASPAPSLGADLAKIDPYDCLINPTGIPAKVTITKDNVRCINRVPDGEPTGATLNFYLPYFIFATYPTSNSPTHYQIGPTPSRSDVIGWVPASLVVRWDTRLGVRPRRDPSQLIPPVVVYADKEAWVEILKTGSTRRPPLARARLNAAGRPFSPWLVIETDRIEINGQIHEVNRIVFVGEVTEKFEAPPTDNGSSAETGRQLSSRVRKLDCVIVIDVTGSMQPYIESAKTAIRDFVRQLTAANNSVTPDVAFGIVAYRDHDDKSKTFVTKVYDLDTNIDQILARVQDLKAADGGDDPEAMFDGIYDALTSIRWRDVIGHKVIITIADTSGHDSGDRQNPRNISRQQLITEANKPGRQAHIFGLITGPTTQDSERRRAWEQLGELANGTGGACFALGNSQAVISQVRDILNRETKTKIDPRIKVVHSIGEGMRTAPEIAAATGLDIRQVTEVLDLFKGAGVPLDNIAPGVPTFTTGWVVCEQQGIAILDREVYLARDEAHQLLSFMNALMPATSSPKQAADILAVSVKGRANPFAAFFKANGPEPMNVFLQARSISTRGDSCLRFTKEQFENDENVRARVRSELPSCIKRLTDATSNRDLWRSRGGADFGWVMENCLP
jgi:hypothetical protein